jgi:hypothetical protein
MRFSALFVAALATAGCGSPDETTNVDHFEPPLVEMPSSDKADGARCDHTTHQASPDITVLSARTLGRAAPSTNTVPADFNIDLSRCDVISDVPYDGYDCQFYDACRELSLDCSAELAETTGGHFVGSARFDNVIYVRSDGEPDRGGQAYEKYYSESFNCQVVEIVTASRAKALPFASALGMYFGSRLSLIPAKGLDAAGTVTLANGEEGTLHRFTGLGLCWSGSMSGSARQVEQFKPFMLFEDGGACWANWDQVPENYRISVQTQAFDRAGEILK